MTRRAKISRRQFLTGGFGARDAALSRDAATAAPSGGCAHGRLGEHDRFGWEDGRQIGRECAAPETAPRIPDWDDGIDRALAELEDLKGIEDF